MIGALISGVAGLAGGIAGGIKARKARKRQQQLIDRQRTMNDAWYNRNYYQNYMDSSEAQSAMKRVEDTLRRRNQEAQAQAAASGGTPEQVLAQQENDQRLAGDVAQNLAAQSSAIKRQVDAQNNINQNNLMQQQTTQYQADEQGASQLLNNGGTLISSALGSMDDLFKKKS